MRFIPFLRVLGIAVGAVCLWAAPALADKTDVVKTRNGDVMTCEIKRLERGNLIIKPAYADNDFKVDWDEVVFMESKRSFLVERDDGMRVVGTFETESEGEFALVSPYGRTVMNRVRIVNIQQVEDSFWARWDPYLGLGYSFTRANNAQQIQLRGGATYRAEKIYFSLSGSSLQNIQDNAEDTRRSDASATLRRVIYDQWFAMAGVSLLSNSEQQLDLRSTTGLGVGRYLIRNRLMIFSASVGIAWNREDYSTPDTEIGNSSELPIGLSYDLYNAEDFGIQSTLTVSPSLSESERYRIDFDAAFSWDLPLDFDFTISYFHNFDSRPPEGVSKSDYGVVTSLDWAP